MVPSLTLSMSDVENCLLFSIEEKNSFLATMFGESPVFNFSLLSFSSALAVRENLLGSTRNTPDEWSFFHPGLNAQFRRF